MGSIINDTQKGTSSRETCRYDVQITKIDPPVFTQLTFYQPPKYYALQCFSVVQTLQKVPIPMEESTSPSDTWFLGPPYSASQTIDSAVFAHFMAENSYTLQWAVTSPLKIACLGDLNPSNACSLGPLESTSRTASRLVLPFLQGSRS